MEKLLSVILGGGQGSRLYPLTLVRSKPAVSFAGKYRLVDIPISNCINSGIRRIFILTQFNSASLNHHIARTYRFDAFSGGFLEILAAQQSYENLDWYQGTADAVRKHLHRFLRADWDDILILAGDQLYKMDFRYLHRMHIEMQADLTIVSIPVNREDASRFGIMKVNEDGFVTDFIEKPGMEIDLSGFRSETSSKPGKPFLASSGIYIFRKKSLEEILSEPGKIDFGKDIIPGVIKSHKVATYPFNDYWEDIGTIRSFFEANLRFCDHEPPLDLFTRKDRFFTRPRFLPGSTIQNTRLNKTVLSEGCRIYSADISQSVIGIRSFIDAGSTLERVVMMGADFYGESDETRQSPGIGKNCIIKNAILDKNVSIGDNCIIENNKRIKDIDGDGYCIRDGIIIMPKNSVIKPGTEI